MWKTLALSSLLAVLFAFENSFWIIPMWALTAEIYAIYLDKKKLKVPRTPSKNQLR